MRWELDLLLWLHKWYSHQRRRRRYQLLGLAIIVPGHHVKRLPLETGPQVSFNEGQLCIHPLSKGEPGFGTLLHSGLQPVLHASVLCHLVNQLQHGLIQLAPRPTACWPGGLLSRG